MMDFTWMNIESVSFDEEVTDNEVDSNVWREIKSESGGECLEDYEVAEPVTSTFEEALSILLIAIDISSLTR